MKHILLTIIIIFITHNIFCQTKTLSDSGKAHKLSIQVTKLFKENKINKAFEKLIPFWAASAEEIESMQIKTLKYLDMLNKSYDGVIGSSEGKTETINDFAIRETYFVLYNKSAIRLIFTYYKSNKGWIVNSFKWDDSFDEEFMTK
tara:strand:- start:296 stop:733 length:438 start_codon:yes stop_codon:yes gene_type:complete